MSHKTELQIEASATHGLSSTEGASFSDLLWRDISTAPTDGTKIVVWFVPSEIHAPEKSKARVAWYEMKQFKDGTGKKVGEPFGIWVAENWREPISYEATFWVPAP